MKDLNLTEAQLRSWRPRRPAAGLKRRIFSSAPAAAPMVWHWGSLAPAIACVILTLMAFNHGGDGFHSKPVMAMVVSNQSAAADALAGEQTAQNHLASVTFDWTNRSGFKSIIGFTPTTNFSN